MPALSERLVLAMALKYAQRRSAEDLAGQLHLDGFQVLSELHELKRSGYVRRWSDGAWSLTSQGNTRRNQLTA